MNDKLYMNNYLLILKSTVEVYVHGTLEAVNQDVRELLRLGLDETLIHQADTYDIMVDNGWYKIKDIEDKTIKNVLSCIKEKNK